MVPFADLFNHKAAVVQLGGGYFVEDVCFENQDSSSEEEHEEDEEENVEAEDEEENGKEENEEVEDEEDQNGRSQVCGLCRSLPNLAKLHDAYKPW